MSERELSIIVGALSRPQKKPKVARSQDAIAKRWRMIATSSPEASSSSDVIPLLDGWIRRLERQAGAGSAPNP